MTVTFTPTKKYTLPGGILVEEGTWADDGLAAPSGTWVADKTVITTEGQIQKVVSYNFANINMNPVGELRYDPPGNQIQILVTANDTGTYLIHGKQA